MEVEQEPRITFEQTVRRITMYGEPDCSVFFEVDERGHIEVLNHRGFFPKKAKNSFGEHNQRVAVYNWLVDWELAVWREIGPEQSECFATKKLDANWGIE
jgi:hypothetical protein